MRDFMKWLLVKWGMSVYVSTSLCILILGCSIYQGYQKHSYAESCIILGMIGIQIGVVCIYYLKEKR